MVEERRGFKKEIKGKKVTKQYRTVFMSAGFSDQPLLFSSTTGRKLKNTTKRLTPQLKRDSDQTSVQLPLQPSLVGFLVTSMHSPVHSLIHPPVNCVNYIPLQCHSFAASSHTITTKTQHSGQDDIHKKM